jgi:hypothetical protein
MPMLAAPRGHYPRALHLGLLLVVGYHSLAKEGGALLATAREDFPPTPEEGEDRPTATAEEEEGMLGA